MPWELLLKAVLESLVLGLKRGDLVVTLYQLVVVHPDLIGRSLLFVLEPCYLVV